MDGAPQGCAHGPPKVNLWRRSAKTAQWAGAAITVPTHSPNPMRRAPSRSQ